MEMLARIDMNTYFLDSQQSLNPAVLQTYMMKNSFWYNQLLNKDKRSLFKMTEGDLPAGIDYIAWVILNEKKKEGHIVAVKDGVITDKINVSGKPLIGIFYNREHSSTLHLKWPKLLSVIDKVNDSDVQYIDDDKMRQKTAYGVNDKNELYAIEPSKNQS
jgi:hypothetical protein